MKRINGSTTEKNTKKTSTPLISVVIPVLNGEATIESLLKSLLKVDYPRERIEVIVVDGNSTDKTLEKVAKYSAKVLIEKKGGPNSARNTGIRHSSGEIVAFTDSDCIVSKNWIKKIIENFKDPRIGCVGGTVKGSNNNFFSKYADNSVSPVIRVCKKWKELDSIGPFSGCPVGCNMAFRRTVLMKVGGFDENIQYCFEEDELVERVCKAGYGVVLDPQVLVWHKHRAIFKNLLKQAFKYGKGTGRLLRRPKNQKLFLRWFFINSCALIQIMLLMAGWQILFLFSLAMFLVPVFLLMTIYACKTRLNGEYKNIFAYPLVDLSRMLAFLAGEICGFVRRV